MSDAIQLTAELRADVGKGASRRLRRLGGKVPAIIYGADEPSQTITLGLRELSRVMEAEAFYSQVLNLVIDGNSQQAVVRDLHRNPVNERVMHVDFQRIRADQEINVNVPLHFINELECIGVKFNHGTVTHNLTEVEISCLPAALPEFIEVDMLEIDTGMSVHLSDLVLPEGVTIVALIHDDEDYDIPIASVTAPRGTSEEEEEAEAAAAVTAAAESAEEDEADEKGGDDSEAS